MRGWQSYFGFCETAAVLIGFDPLGPVAAQSGSVAAVENTAPSPGSAVDTRGTSAAGQQHRWQRPGPWYLA
jgi:hypothetical protein